MRMRKYKRKTDGEVHSIWTREHGKWKHFQININSFGSKRHKIEVHWGLYPFLVI